MEILQRTGENVRFTCMSYSDRREFMRILLAMMATVFAYVVLYSPQPLLPFFSHTFGVAKSQAALLITVTMLPMSLAPLSYGYLLESLSATKLLRGAILLLAVTVAGFACATSFNLLLIVRFLQGLLLPAALTSIMTYLSATAPKDRIQRIMSFYITATIMGGFLGRLVAGGVATYFHWRLFFAVLALLLLICFFLLKQLQVEEVQLHPTRPNMATLAEVVKTGNNALVLLSVICLFFVFVALLNFLPFRLAGLRKGSSELFTAFMYSGYLMGAFASMAAGRLVRRLRGETNAMVLGFLCYSGAIIATLIPNEWTLFAAIFLFCGSMFFVHTVAAAVVNKNSMRYKGIVNGLYVACYYGGGVLGSYLPGIVYERYGWDAFVLLLLAIAGFGLAIALINRYCSPNSYVADELPENSICMEANE
jgi:MFS transporter, YNFM family, putative membrane transport protein